MRMPSAMSAGADVCACAAAVKASASSAEQISRLPITSSPRRHCASPQLGVDRAAGYDPGPYAKTKGCIEAPMASRTAGRLVAALAALIACSAPAGAEELRRATVWD